MHGIVHVTLSGSNCTYEYNTQRFVVPFAVNAYILKYRCTMNVHTHIHTHLHTPMCMYMHIHQKHIQMWQIKCLCKNRKYVFKWAIKFITNLISIVCGGISTLQGILYNFRNSKNNRVNKKYSKLLDLGKQMCLLKFKYLLVSNNFS